MTREARRRWERANRLMDAAVDGNGWGRCRLIKLSPAVLRWQREDPDYCRHMTAQMLASAALDGMDSRRLP